MAPWRRLVSLDSHQPPKPFDSTHPIHPSYFPVISKIKQLTTKSEFPKPSTDIKSRPRLPAAHLAHHTKNPTRFGAFSPVLARRRDFLKKAQLSAARPAIPLNPGPCGPLKTFFSLLRHHHIMVSIECTFPSYADAILLKKIGFSRMALFRF